MINSILALGCLRGHAGDLLLEIGDLFKLAGKYYRYTHSFRESAHQTQIRRVLAS